MSLEIYTKKKVIKENTNKSIYLILNELDGLYYIERVLPKNNIDMYQKLRNIDSPFFPTIYELIEQDDKLIVIEDYINLRTLEHYILNNEIKENEVSNIIIELCQAVSLLHQNGIIHRDIKPSNIFYNGQDIILFDFDIARVYDDNQKQDTRVLGSVGYAAPEQFGFKQTDERTDIYAIGVLMNVLYTSKLPNDQLYEGKEKDVIVKATQIDPDKRYQNCDEMMHALSYHQPLKFTLPGFRQRKVSHMVIASLIYAYIILGFIFSNSAQGVVKWSLLDIYEDITLFIMMFIVIAFVTNYLDVYSHCLFHTNENKAIRVTGIMMTLGIVSFIYILVVGVFQTFIFG